MNALLAPSQSSFAWIRPSRSRSGWSGGHVWRRPRKCEDWKSHSSFLSAASISILPTFSNFIVVAAVGVIDRSLSVKVILDSMRVFTRNGAVGTANRFSANLPTHLSARQNNLDSLLVSYRPLHLEKKNRSHFSAPIVIQSFHFTSVMYWTIIQNTSILPRQIFSRCRPSSQFIIAPCDLPPLPSRTGMNSSGFALDGMEASISWAWQLVPSTIIRMEHEADTVIWTAVLLFSLCAHSNCKYFPLQD